MNRLPVIRTLKNSTDFNSRDKSNFNNKLFRRSAYNQAVGNKLFNQKSPGGHKLWLILGIVLVILAVLFIIFYPTIRENLFGRAGDLGGELVCNDGLNNDGDILGVVVGDNGKVLSLENGNWAQETVPTSNKLKGVWGSSSSDIWVVGDLGTILQFDGQVWTTAYSAPNINLNAISGTSADDIWAVGTSGTILHYNNNQWNLVDSGTSQNLLDVWANSANDVWAVGTGGLILHYNGWGWVPVDSGVTNTLFGVWADSNSNEVWAVGDGVILHYNGLEWIQTLGFSGTYYSVRGISVPGALLNVWVGGANILYYNGNSWSTASGPYGQVWDFHGTSPTDIWAVGSGGLILHYDGAAWNTIKLNIGNTFYGIRTFPLIDCADSDCSADIACSSPPPPAVTEICDNTVDDDGDGLADCDDSDCLGTAACSPPPPTPSALFSSPTNTLFLSECGELLQEGTKYILNNDVAADPNPTAEVSECFSIKGSNIILDCQGHSITSSGPELLQRGITFPGDDYNNIQIKNCQVSNFDKGISIYGNLNLVLENNIFQNNGEGITIIGDDTSGPASVNILDTTSCGNSDYDFSCIADSALNALVMGSGNYFDKIRECSTNQLQEDVHYTSCPGAEVISCTDGQKVDGLQPCLCDSPGLEVIGDTCSGAMVKIKNSLDNTESSFALKITAIASALKTYFGLS